MKTFLLISASVIMLHSSSIAQNNISLLKNSLQHFIQNTFKMSWEKQTSTNRSFLISPSITLQDNYNDNDTLNTYGSKIYGAGLELSKRFYLGGLNKDSSKALNGVYAGISVSYNYYYSQYRDEYAKIIDTSYQYTYYYGNYYRTLYKPFEERIHRLGTDFVLGYQKSFWNILYVDVFLGGGIRYGISSRGSDTYYNYDFIDYAYRGIIPKAGVLLGVKL